MPGMSYKTRSKDTRSNQVRADFSEGTCGCHCACSKGMGHSGFVLAEFSLTVGYLIGTAIHPVLLRKT